LNHIFPPQIPNYPPLPTGKIPHRTAPSTTITSNLFYPIHWRHRIIPQIIFGNHSHQSGRFNHHPRL